MGTEALPEKTSKAHSCCQCWRHQNVLVQPQFPVCGVLHEIEDWLLETTATVRPFWLSTSSSHLHSSKFPAVVPIHYSSFF